MDRLSALPAEIVYHIGDISCKKDVVSLSATCRRLEYLLARNTWDQVHLQLLQTPLSPSLPKRSVPVKKITVQDLDKFYQMVQLEGVQACIKQLVLCVDKTSFEYAKRKDTIIPVELERPCQLDQLLLHMIPAFCHRLEHIQVNLPDTVVPVQIETMISRLPKQVDVTFTLGEGPKGLKSILYRAHRLHYHSNSYGTKPHAIASLNVDCPKLTEKKLSGFLKNYQNLKVLSVFSPFLQITTFKWVPQSVAHLQLTVHSPYAIRRHGETIELPNLRSLRIAGRWPDFSNVKTPKLRTIWVGLVTSEITDFIKERRVTDVIVSSDLSMPMFVAADPQNLCPNVRTLVLYGIADESTILGFLKLLPNLCQVLCYLNNGFNLSEIQFKKLMLKKMSHRVRLRVMYVCAPQWKYRTHEVRTGTSKRLVMLSQSEFFQKLGCSTLGN